MNANKVEKTYKSILNLVKEDLLNDEEYLVLVANMLITFGKAGISSDSRYSGINMDDAGVIELALTQDPTNVYLAAILQGHAILKWSESVPGE